MKQIVKGLGFGMMLQLAVGPLCILVFQIAANRGFLLGLCMVLAIALGDTLFILLACLGAAALLNKPGVKTVLKVIGSLVLVLFGADMVLSAFSLSFLPVFTNAIALSPDNLFLQGFFTYTFQPPDHPVLGRNVFDTGVTKQLEPFKALSFCVRMRPFHRSGFDVCSYLRQCS